MLVLPLLSPVHNELLHRHRLPHPGDAIGDYRPDMLLIDHIGVKYLPAGDQLLLVIGGQLVNLSDIVLDIRPSVAFVCYVEIIIDTVKGLMLSLLGKALVYTALLPQQSTSQLIMHLICTEKIGGKENKGTI